MNIIALIVDDEQPSREAIQELLQEFCPQVRIVGATGNIEEAMLMIGEVKPDVLFLDINLGKRTGFDLLNMLGQQAFDVVFITAYEDFALKAFEYAAVNYLLKPVNYEQLIESIRRIERKKSTNINSMSKLISDVLPNTRPLPGIIPLSDMRRTDFVQVDTIVYLEAKGAYTVLYLNNGEKHVKSKNLKLYEAFFKYHSQFVRVHKSYIVNKNYIKAYKKDTAELVCANGILIPTTLAYKILLGLII
ncbi:hypothetical protein DBR32_12880 [Taibaiella sp. KBW10]|uniref:LytR/AlgR family response regulator transcription factor n=1 Tax=Taibaiella sp. KBW10 TaxID=2153357 RepID=UPI000F5B5ECF|nr:LytTR family DNA-binding domain-containing protein [Taibaiella sp. KBW10]RQO30453.1 hypothetical protein DBR32_12880 [Taibaiella sp. KBW10]